MLVIAPFSTPFAPLACASNGTPTASVDLALNAGDQVIVTIDGFAALCGNYQLSITRDCTSACTSPPACGVSPGTCSAAGQCVYTSKCEAGELCRNNACVDQCLVNPHLPC